MKYVGPMSWIRSHIKTVGGFLVGLAAIAGTTVAVLQYRDSKASAAQVRIMVNLPSGGVIERCAKLDGTAPLLKGYELWVSYETPYKNFSLAKADHRPDGVWTQTSTVGGKNDANVKYILRVFYLTQKESVFLNGIRGLGDNGGDGYWFAAELPPTIFHETSTTVTRNTSKNVPPCGGR